MNAILTSVLLTLAGTFALLLLAVSEWLSPISPMLYGLLLVTPAAVGISTALFDELRSGGAKNKKLWVSIVLSALVGGGLSASWMAPQTRIQAIQNVSGLRVSLALDDPSADVQLAACTQLFGTDIPNHELSAKLSRKLSLATSCLAANEANPRAKLISRQVSTSWHGQLMLPGGEDSAALSCAITESLQKLPADRSSVNSIVLDCMLRSESEASRGCCAKALEKSAPSCETLPMRVSRADLKAWRTVPDLFAASFLISDNKSKQLPEGHPNLACDEVKQRSVGLLCDVLLYEDDTEREEAFFEWLMESNKECMDTAERSEWLRADEVCEQLATELESEGKFSTARLCDTQRTLAKAQLAEAKKARETYNESSRNDLTAQIIEGSAIASRGGLGGAMDRFQNFASSDCLNPNTQRKLMLGLIEKTPSGLGVESTLKTLDEINEMNKANLSNPKLADQFAEADEEDFDPEEFTEEATAERDELLEKTKKKFRREKRAITRKKGYSESQRHLACIKKKGVGCELPDKGWTKPDRSGAYVAPCLPSPHGGMDEKLDRARHKILSTPAPY